MSWSSRNRCAGSRIIPIGTVFAALGPTYATECVAQPQVGLEIDAVAFASDNPFLIPGDDRGSAGFDLAARPYADWQLDPTTNFRLTGELAFRQYTRSYGNFVTGFADAELHHRHNEFLSVTASANYSSELSSDILTDSADAAFDSRGIRETIDLQGTVDWNPSATTTITTRGAWHLLSYPDSRLLDQRTEAYDFNIGAVKKINSRTGLGAEVGLTSSRPEGGERSSANTLSLIANSRLSEHWSGDIRLGVEWSRMSGPFDDPEDSRTRFSGDLNLCYEPQHTTACVTSTLGSEISGLGGGLQREFYVGGNVSTRISQNGTFTAEAGLRKNNVSGTNVSGQVMSASAGYEHRLNRTLYLTSRAGFMRRQINDAKIGNFVVQFGLSIRGDRS